MTNLPAFAGNATPPVNPGRGWYSIGRTGLGSTCGWGQPSLPSTNEVELPKLFDTSVRQITHNRRPLGR